MALNNDVNNGDFTLVSNQTLYKINRYLFLNQSKLKTDNEIILLGKELEKELGLEVKNDFYFS